MPRTLRRILLLGTAGLAVLLPLQAGAGSSTSPTTTSSTLPCPQSTQTCLAQLPPCMANATCPTVIGQMSGSDSQKGR